MERRKRKSAQIRSFESPYHYVAASREYIGQVLTGHLAIEFMLKQLIIQYDMKLAVLSDDLTHAKLILLNRDIGSITYDQAEVLILINKLRNQFSHEVEYRPTLEEMLILFKAAVRAFSDYCQEIQDGLTQLSTRGLEPGVSVVVGGSTLTILRLRQFAVERQMMNVSTTVFAITCSVGLLNELAIFAAYFEKCSTICLKRL